jgi:hypothetical protein
MTKKLKKLNRYTTLPVLLDMLNRKRIVLLNPQSWDDKNDSQIIEEYKRRQGVQNLFALCFSYGDETIHHWKAYADGTSGCCIEFNAEKLLRTFSQQQFIRFRTIEYKKIRDVGDNSIKTEDIPFTKRWPYRYEEEFRVIWEGSTSENYIEIPFDLACINKITISQQMPNLIYETIRTHLKEVFRQPDKRISKSTLYENRVWISKFQCLEQTSN